jgi:predicted nucleotidyltransferase
LIELTHDFEELLTELADARAEFVLVGGYAVGFHGHARATKDIDILIRPTPENAARVMKALLAFGAPVQSLKISEDDFAAFDGVIQFGAEPNRIDILTKVSGISYDEALVGSHRVDVNGRSITIIGLDPLIKNKIAAGRGQDIIDAEALERHRSGS